MAHTKHHNAPKRPKLLKLTDKYTGWLGEEAWRQKGRRFIKRLEHRHNRRWKLADFME
jgi:hypothetical protein